MANKIRINYSADKGAWAKVVTSVDTTKRNGYAFDGYFLNNGLTDVPTGSVIVHKDRRGVGRVYIVRDVDGNKDKDCWVEVTGEGSIETVYAGNWDAEFLAIRDAAQEAMGVSIQEDNALAAIDDSALIREMERRGFIVARKDSPNLMQQLFSHVK